MLEINITVVGVLRLFDVHASTSLEEKHRVII